jgi:hypothetical protein
VIDAGRPTNWTGIDARIREFWEFREFREAPRARACARRRVLAYSRAPASRSAKSLPKSARQPTAVERILRLEDYKRGQIKIIDPRLWNATQAALASRRKRPAAR